MKGVVQQALLLLAVTGMCPVGLAVAGDAYVVSNGSRQPTGSGGAEDVASPSRLLGIQDSEYARIGSSPPAKQVADPWAGVPKPCWGWSIDYRVRGLFDSHTSYQFGTHPLSGGTQFAPLSKLDWDLDSAWHGFQIGLHGTTWRTHFEWLMPLERELPGVMADYDWNIYPPDDPNRLDSLTHSSLRWNDGQMLELGGEFDLTAYLFLDPSIEIWPAAGFRFQRLNMTGCGIDYIVPPLGPDPAFEDVAVITFNQQYYVGYFGAQLRTVLHVAKIPIDLRFQADAGPAAGFNVDHHLLREGDRYTRETTHGGAWHLALAAETALRKRLRIGLQADYSQIRTTGTHRLVNVPLDIDLSWDHGVLVKSDQASLTGFVRLSF